MSWVIHNIALNKISNKSIRILRDMSRYQIKYNMGKTRNSKWYTQVCHLSNISRRPIHEGAVCVCVCVYMHEVQVRVRKEED